MWMKSKAQPCAYVLLATCSTPQAGILKHYHQLAVRTRRWSSAKRPCTSLFTPNSGVLLDFADLCGNSCVIDQSRNSVRRSALVCQCRPEGMLSNEGYLLRYVNTNFIWDYGQVLHTLDLLERNQSWVPLNWNWNLVTQY